MADLVLLVELHITPGRMDDFLRRAREHRANVLAKEPGCRGFELLRSREAEDTLWLYEVYADEAALETHLNTPYMKQYMEDTAPMVAKRARTLCEKATG